MSKKPLSDMTAQDFVEITAALGLKYIELARALNRTSAIVSMYSTGKAPIPEEVRYQLEGMIAARRKALEAAHFKALPTVASMVVATNEIRQATQRDAAPRLVHRSASPEARTYPTYRMSGVRQQAYVAALAAWYERIAHVLKNTSDPREHREYSLELADTKVLLESARGVEDRGMPYVNCITRSEWHVVSRALRHRAQTTKHPGTWALYQHWRRHKGCGYPRASQAQP